MKHNPSWTRHLRRGVAAAGLTLAAGVGAYGLLPATAHASAASVTRSTTYAFTTLNDQADPTFNQLLGINNHNVISGYFGSGAAGHPNRGYLLDPPYAQASYVNENYPGSAQTQVTGLNGKADTSGFWASKAGANNGFVEWNGSYQTLNDPNLPHIKTHMDQLLGVNDNGVAVGFWVGATNHSHAYQVNQATRVFTAIKVPGAVQASATGINNLGDIVGFATDASHTTFGWLLKNGHVSTYQFPGGSDTQAFGVNANDEIVGTYLDGAGVQHGFTLKSPLGPVSHWQSIDDPNGVGSTTINGVNKTGDLVGFYTDAAGNVDGMLAMPNQAYLQMQAMPSGTAGFGTGRSGDLTTTVDAFGLTPGSSHAVRLLAGDGATVAKFSTLTANGTGQADATLDSSYTGSIPTGSRLVILNGSQPKSGTPSGETIAETPDLDSGLPTSPLPLTGVEFSATGKGFGIPAGNASVTYSPAAQTLTVTLNASGVTPGSHAAHIHLGSCQSQGAVQYMLMDFTANSNGQISNETRTVTGVTRGIPATGWYLNLHQGTSQTIVKNGVPTIAFRPLLCANF